MATKRSPALTKREWLALFWARVDVNLRTGCWDWLRSTDVNGYGIMRTLGGGNARAHRISYELEYGPVPVGLFVLHHCDNRLCVNPTHLYAGTKSQNAQDREDRGRGHNVKGVANPNVKLSLADVAHIRLVYSGRYGERARLAEQFGVSGDLIYKIVSGQNWKVG